MPVDVCGCEKVDFASTKYQHTSLWRNDLSESMPQNRGATRKILRLTITNVLTACLKNQTRRPRVYGLAGRKSFFDRDACRLKILQ